MSRMARFRSARRRSPRAAKVLASVLAAAALAAAASTAGLVQGGSANHFAIRSSDLANRCFAIASRATARFIATSGAGSYRASAARAHAVPFYLEPTGLRTYLLFDRDGQLLGVPTRGGAASVVRAGTPDPTTEWALTRVRGRDFTINSTADRLQLAVTTDRSRGLTLTSPGRAGARRLFAFASGRGCRQYPEAQVGAFGRPFTGKTRAGRVTGFVDLHVHVTADMRAGGSVIYGESFDRFGITRALSAEGDAKAHGQDGVLDVTGNLIRHGSPTGTHDNHGWPTFKGWPTHDTITHQQVYYVWLKRAWMAGMRLIVAQTVEDHALCDIEPRKVRTCDELQSIVGQVQRLREMQDYIDAQSGGRGRGWFRLVYDPRQARRVIERGKLAVVIGVESSDPFGCSEFLGLPQCTKADVDRGLDEFYRLGVRTMFPVHWIDNAFAGAALEGGAQGTFINALNVRQTGLPFSTETCTRPGEIEQPSGDTAIPGSGPQCNTRGLTDLGAYLIRRMIAKHMLIEADHMSEKTRDTVLAIAQTSHYPLVSSHNGTGGSWSTSQLRALYDLGGMVAVTPDTAPKLADKVLALRRLRGSRNDFGVGIGTDTGGLGGQPRPRVDAARRPLRYPFRSYDGKVEFVRERTGDFVYDLNHDGVAHYGLIPDLLADIQQSNGNSNALPQLFRSAEAYLEMWQRAAAHR
jgi:microsomal dipeptidase-like Zn-dependent dipeptidase